MNFLHPLRTSKSSWPIWVNGTLLYISLFIFNSCYLLLLNKALYFKLNFVWILVYFFWYFLLHSLLAELIDFLIENLYFLKINFFFFAKFNTFVYPIGPYCWIRMTTTYHYLLTTKMLPSWCEKPSSLTWLLKLTQCCHPWNPIDYFHTVPSLNALIKSQVMLNP